MATIKVCDVCNSDEHVKTSFYATDRVSDAAGSMEDVGKTHDLCSRCELSILRLLVKQISLRMLDPEPNLYKINEWIVSEIKRRISNRRNAVSVS